MFTLCEPLPRSLIEELLQIAARAICDRPGESRAQGESRTRQMVHTVIGLEPRDGLEYMLATTTVGHFHLIFDSMRDVFRGQPDLIKAKLKTSIVALGRSLLGLLKELRLVRQRPLALPVDAGVREPTVPPAAAQPMPAAERPARSPVQPAPAPSAGPLRNPEQTCSEPAAPEAQPTAAARPLASRPAGEPDLGAVQAWLRVPGSETGAAASSATGRPPWSDQDEACLIEKMAAFERLLAEVNGRPAELPSPEPAKTAADDAD